MQIKKDMALETTPVDSEGIRIAKTTTHLHSITHRLIKLTSSMSITTTQTTS